MPYIAVGDTHGELEKVEALIELCGSRGLLETHKFVFVGDYFDRGPNVKGLIDLLINLQKEGHVCIAGNHEYVLREAIRAPRGERKEQWAFHWWRDYERKTLSSYDLGYLRAAASTEFGELVTVFENRLRELGHFDFLMSLPLWHESGNLIFIHAGILPKLGWEYQKVFIGCEDDVPPQLISYEAGRALTHSEPEKTVISGHTRVTHPVVTKNRVMLDTGCGAGGPLSAWVSDTNEIIQV